MKRKRFYIVEKSILPNSIQNVIEVNELIQKEKISKHEAIKKIGISRSTYYKYKDYIKPFYNGEREKIYNIYLLLEDKPGILARVLDIIADENVNLLTIVQNMAVDGISRVTLSLQIGEDIRKIEEMLERISSLDLVKELRIIGSN